MRKRLNKIAATVLLTVFLFSLLAEFNVISNSIYSLLLRFCFLPVMLITVITKGYFCYFLKK